MNQFWERSWDNVDPKRVREYVNGTDLSSDPIIGYLKKQRVKAVCDAGCGCGAYSLKLAANGFQVCGFDVSSTAVEMAKQLLSSRNFTCADFRTADILSTGYPDNQFDAVIARDVIDHMTFQDGIAAVKELYRITKPGGFILLTLDNLDTEYETEPHQVNSDGDYLFTGGKWKGMVFHPYTKAQISQLVRAGTLPCLETGPDGYQVTIAK